MSLLGRIGAGLISLGMQTTYSEHGDVARFSVLGIPLFTRDSAGKARIVGLHAKRLDR